MENINLSREIIKNYNLSKKHLFKKVAGNAKFYYQLQYDNNLNNDLIEISKLYNTNTSFKIFGSHTNIYITENGYNGLFIDINPQKSKIIFNKEKEEFIVSANTLTSKLVNNTMNLGYDFASLTGIPGMVGSGVVGNASWSSKKDYGKYVKKVILFDFKECKEIEIIPNEYFFSIRNSFIKKENFKETRYFVKEIILKSEYIGKEKVKEKYLEQINKRRESLKIGFSEGCAGSIWCNLDLRNKIGKGLKEIITNNPEFNINFNGARYSNNGSRFFITDNTTTDQDVAKLFNFTIEKFKELYNIEPIKEVLILDYDGEIDLHTFIKRYL
ncbi:MAG: hypothetical protein IJV31_02155 [Clostridia bacterium]|nr:hypothetical protein [Clostridia bacterium]